MRAVRYGVYLPFQTQRPKASPAGPLDSGIRAGVIVLGPNQNRVTPPHEPIIYATPHVVPTYNGFMALIRGIQHLGWPNQPFFVSSMPVKQGVNKFEHTVFRPVEYQAETYARTQTDMLLQGVYSTELSPARDRVLITRKPALMEPTDYQLRSDHDALRVMSALKHVAFKLMGLKASLPDEIVGLSKAQR